MAHTAGPWATSRDAVPHGHTQITVYAPDSDDGLGQRVATVFLTADNARLIAAAPDLLAACRELLEYPVTDDIEDGFHYQRQRAYQVARAAIVEAL